MKKTKNKMEKRSKVFVLGSIALIVLFFSLIFKFDLKVKPNSQLLSVFSNVTPTLTVAPTPNIGSIIEDVVPTAGYSVDIIWGDTGRKLIETGAIDLAKYQEIYKDPVYVDLLTYLTEDKNQGITISQKNAYFWVNTLWALGLTQKSDVLEKGIMGTEYKSEIGNFASTGGWTLGKKDAVKLYSANEIIPLDSSQQKIVAAISENIYRPCCGNPTSFPDCNHGMAILGLIELMASQGFSENEIYKAALYFNSYWFRDTYVDLAYYFQTKEGMFWQNIDPKKILSAEFSSGQGYANIKKQIGNIPGIPSSGGSCGA